MQPISVSIVYALPQRQWLKHLTVPRGTSAKELVEQSGVLDEFPELMGSQPRGFKLGVFSQPVSGETLLEEGDRVEIYRPLQADPKEVRRQLAKLGKSMGQHLKSE